MFISGDIISGVARDPQAPQSRGGGGVGLKGPSGARQEEVVAVTPWPGAQTSCLRGPENRRYATGYNIRMSNGGNICTAVDGNI